MVDSLSPSRAFTVGNDEIRARPLLEGITRFRLEHVLLIMAAAREKVMGVHSFNLQGLITMSCYWFMPCNSRNFDKSVPVVEPIK